MPNSIDATKKNDPHSPAVHKAKERRDSYDITTLTADKATRRVLAPYVRAVRRTQKISASQPERRVSIFLQKKPSRLFKNLSEFLLDVVDLPLLLHETADILKTITTSSGVNLYTVDTDQGEIVQCSRNPQSPRHKVNWKISTGTTVAAYAAAMKEYVLVNDVLKDLRFPDGLGWFAPLVRAVLCVPVITPDDDCIAVIELYRSVKEAQYSKIELQIVMAVSCWMGVAIHQNQQRVVLQKQQELNDYLLELAKCQFADIVYMEKIISEIVVFAKGTLGAERGSFFIIDQECDELVADLFDEGIEAAEDESRIMHKKKLKIRFSRDRGIAGLVARTGKTVNIKDVYNDPRFNKEVYLQTGFITRSILCMPIMGRDRVLGVVQLINKKNGPCFTNADENIFKTFSVYCALALHFTNLQDQMQKVECRNSIKTNMLTFHMTPCKHAINHISISPYMEELPKDFNSFSWYLMGYEDSLCELVLHMIRDMLGEDFHEVQPWIQFVLTVKKSYRDNPYHNFHHGFNVCHCMYNILKRNMKSFSPIEIQALLVASLCHDLDHQGTTNNFLQMSHHYIAQLYPESPLENHHFQVAMLIINASGIFSMYSTQTFKELTQEIHDAILATDLAFYFRCRARLLLILDEDKFDWSEGSHKLILKNIMMSSCEVSALCKPFSVAKKITESCYAEFYSQGDAEKEMGVCPLPTMDRDKNYMIPEDQVNFISVVCLPCISLLVELLPNTAPLLEQCQSLQNHWKEIIELRGQKVWQHEDSLSLPLK